MSNPNPSPATRVTGGTPGNVSNGRIKPWKDALHRAIVQHSNRDVLFKIANTVLNNALEGDIHSIREVADRLDGKPAQQQILTGADDGAVKVDTNLRGDELNARIKALITKLKIEE